MSDSHIEKAFLYFVLFSLLLHGAAFILLVTRPDKKPPVLQEPYMVELEDLPGLQEPRANDRKDVRRHAETRRRVAREAAPKGERQRERIASAPVAPFTGQPRRPVEMPSAPREEERKPAVPPSAPPAKELLRPKRERLPELNKLFPSSNRMARLEDSYRKRYGPEVEEGETKFLNTDDIQFGSFLRRFETAVYGVWRYPSDAARLGIEGVTPVKITFNRKGEVENVQLLESSGSKILDNEVFRTLGMIGPIGSFPKGYEKERFYLIAFFQYGISRGGSQGVLR